MSRWLGRSMEVRNSRRDAMMRDPESEHLCAWIKFYDEKKNSVERTSMEQRQKKSDVANISASMMNEISDISCCNGDHTLSPILL